MATLMASTSARLSARVPRQRHHLERHQRAGGQHHQPRPPPPAPVQRPALEQRQRAVEHEGAEHQSQVARGDRLQEPFGEPDAEGAHHVLVQRLGQVAHLVGSAGEDDDRERGAAPSPTAAFASL